MAKFKILVPVDFSKESEHALDLALEMGHARKAEIYLFHVHEGRTKDYRELDRINEDMMQKMKAVMVEAIERAAALGIQRTIEQVFRRLSNGKPSEEIIKMADAINADMIVMHYGKGSTAERIIKKTPCSVMVVREKEID